MTKSQTKPRKHACAWHGLPARETRRSRAPLEFGIWNLGFFWDLGFRDLGFPLKAAILLLALCAAHPPLRAQYEMQQVALIDQTPIIIEVPFPFVDASRILPDAFGKRRLTAATAAIPSRLIGWFIPTSSLKDELNEKTTRYRTLQVQVQKDMEPVRYDPEHLKAMRDDFLLKTPNVPVIGEADVATLFSIRNLSQFNEKPSKQFLGLADLGPDSFTLCIATSIEGKDLSGGRPIETSIICVTNILLKGKILQLTATGPELSAAELRNTLRLTREWITLLRAATTLTSATATPPPKPPADEWHEWKQLEIINQKLGTKR